MAKTGGSRTSLPPVEIWAIAVIEARIALLSSMIVFDERLAGNEWAGIGLIGGGLALITALALAGGRRASLLPADPTPLEGG